MPAQTLLNMAIQKCIRLVAQISDFADMPYELARPILLKVENPQQLVDIETNCPHIADQSEELWRRFIARDIPDWQSKMEFCEGGLANPRSWHRVYSKLVRAEERNAAKAEEDLRLAMQGQTVKKVQAATLVVKKTLPHPRTFDDVKDLKEGPKKPPTLKNAKTGSDRLAAIRRQSAFSNAQKSHSTPLRTSTQAQQLASAKRQITRAPESMVREISRASHLTIAPRDPLPHELEQLAEIRRARAYNTKIIAPKAQDGHRHIVQAGRQKALADNEAKLRALTSQQKKEEPARPKKEFDFAPSPIVVSPANRSLSPGTPTDKATDRTLPAALERFNDYRALNIVSLKLHTKLPDKALVAQVGDKRKRAPEDAEDAGSQPSQPTAKSSLPQPAQSAPTSSSSQPPQPNPTSDSSQPAQAAPTSSSSQPPQDDSTSSSPQPPAAPPKRANIFMTPRKRRRV